jgi:LPXTG-motif cell wall-anchored protein
VIGTSGDTDWKAFHWHLFLWDPWFLIWGLLLGAATWGFTRRRTER